MIALEFKGAKLGWVIIWSVGDNCTGLNAYRYFVLLNLFTPVTRSIKLMVFTFYTDSNHLFYFQCAFITLPSTHLTVLHITVYGLKIDKLISLKIIIWKAQGVPQ